MSAVELCRRSLVGARRRRRRALRCTPTHRRRCRPLLRILFSTFLLLNPVTHDPARHPPTRPSVAATTAAAASGSKKLVLVVAAALIDAQERRVLLAQRPPGKAMAGLWEFPGGKVDAGETPEAALARELREELSIEVRLGGVGGGDGCAARLQGAALLPGCPGPAPLFSTTRAAPTDERSDATPPLATNRKKHNTTLPPPPATRPLPPNNNKVDPADLEPLTFASHSYDSFHLLMPLYACRRWRGDPAPAEGQALAWAAAGELSSYEMPAADVPLVAPLVAALEGCKQ